MKKKQNRREPVASHADDSYPINTWAPIIIQHTEYATNASRYLRNATDDSR